MPEAQPNGGQNGKVHEEFEDFFRAWEKVRDEEKVLNSRGEKVEKIREELDALKADKEKIQKIRKELDDLKERQTKAAMQFEIQKERGAFWNKIEAILVPILSAAVFGLASWVWQSEGKIGNAELRITGLQNQVEAMESRTRSGTSDRYTRTHAERDHERLKEDI